MNENDFEGSIVLEKLADIGKVPEFFDAIDSDNFKKAKALMKQAGLDSETIQQVLTRMGESSGH